MNSSANVDLSTGRVKRFAPGMLPAVRSTAIGLLVMLLVVLAMMMPTLARAVDGCKVLLSLAAPNWRPIPECVPTINQLHRDLGRGKPFPTCSMAGAGYSANNSWASAPSNCPPQYTRVYEGESGPIYSCDYSGAVTVSINGAPFTRTWWSKGGDTVTAFTPTAKTQLGTWDSKFDDDYATWLASMPTSVPPCATC